MNTEQQLPEDIQGKIEDYSNSKVLQAACEFGYHLRDEEVEGLKDLTDKMRAEIHYRDGHIEQQSATIIDLLQDNIDLSNLVSQQSVTISELLQGLERIKSSSFNGGNAGRIAQQLLQKHKP